MSNSMSKTYLHTAIEQIIDAYESSTDAATVIMRLIHWEFHNLDVTGANLQLLEDMVNLRPDLNHAQAWTVLKTASETWHPSPAKMRKILKSTADKLFPTLPS